MPIVVNPPPVVASIVREPGAPPLRTPLGSVLAPAALLALYRHRTAVHEVGGGTFDGLDGRCEALVVLRAHGLPIVEASDRAVAPAAPLPFPDPGSDLFVLRLRGKRATDHLPRMYLVNTEGTGTLAFAHPCRLRPLRVETRPRQRRGRAGAVVAPTEEGTIDSIESAAPEVAPAPPEAAVVEGTTDSVESSVPEGPAPAVDRPPLSPKASATPSPSSSPVIIPAHRVPRSTRATRPAPKRRRCAFLEYEASCSGASSGSEESVDDDDDDDLDGFIVPDDAPIEEMSDDDANEEEELRPMLSLSPRCGSGGDL